MYINDFGLLLPMLLAVAMAFVLFLIDTFNVRSLERLARVAPDSVSQRRKLPRNPNIICMLPMHEEKRPEQRLW